MKNYLVKIRGGVEVDSYGKKAGKGPLIAEEISHTLGTSQDQYLFQAVEEKSKAIGFMRGLGGVQTMNEKMPTLQAANGTSGNNKPCVAIGVDFYNLDITGKVAKTHTAGRNDKNHIPCVVTFEPGIASRDGGHVYENVSGNNQPLVICMATQQGGAEILEDKSPTITAAAGMSGNNQPVICLQGNGIDRTDTTGRNGKGWTEDVSYTLNTIDRHAVAYRANAYDELEQTEKGATLKACGGNYGGGSENLCVERKRKAIEMNNQEEYIVRRLTPLECNRLQGFPDGWGEIDHKEDFTEEEYRFWLDVRNTFAEINGKQVKDYTKEQMLKWYNKLHTDSAEYKMWGNGIALPCAIHVMQGIVRETGGQHEKGLHTL